MCVIQLKILHDFVPVEIEYKKFQNDKKCKTVYIYVPITCYIVIIIVHFDFISTNV